MNQIIKNIMHLKTLYAIRPVIVSSGAINAGRTFLKSVEQSDMSSLQASSSIGQILLMQKFQDKFSKKNP